MTSYGILLVDTSWANHDTAEIDKTTFLRHQDQIGEGAQALIFVRAPIDAVVAEAEVTSSVIETETTPPDPAFNPAIPANLRLERAIDRIESEGTPLTTSQEVAHIFRVPLKIMRIKGQVAPIPLSRMRAVLGADFSVFDETWIPLSEDQYQQITAAWNKEKAP